MKTNQNISRSESNELVKDSKESGMSLNVKRNASE
jgi:hypothetical protein